MSHTIPDVTARNIIDNITHDAIDRIEYDTISEETTITFSDDSFLAASEDSWDEEVTGENVTEYSWVIHNPGDDPRNHYVLSSYHSDELRDAIIEHADTITNHNRFTERFTPMSLPTARQVINAIEHEAIDSVKATHDGHIVRFIDGSHISATHHTKGEVPEYHPEIKDEDSEQWEEPAGYNWVYVKADETPHDAYPDANDDPVVLKGAIIRAADDALERHPWPHTQVLTTTVVSDHGDSATVSWIPEEITGYDEAKENIGIREWAWETVNEAPVHWFFDQALKSYLLQADILRFTGTHELVVTAHRVHHPNDLSPGTFWIHP